MKSVLDGDIALKRQQKDRLKIVRDGIRKIVYEDEDLESHPALVGIRPVANLLDMTSKCLLRLFNFDLGALVIDWHLMNSKNTSKTIT